MIRHEQAIAGDAARGDGDFDASLARDGVIDIAIRGVWTSRQVDGFFSAIEPLWELVRFSRGRVLALIVVETVQSPPIALQVRARTLAVKVPGDRNAFVVRSALSRLQINRLGGSSGFALFTNSPAARKWLLEGR